MSVILSIADAVAAELNTGSFSESFTAQRSVLPIFQLADLTTLKVTIVPKAVETTAISRSMSQLDVQIDIGIQKKLGKQIDTEVEPLMELVEEIAAFLRGRQLQSLTNVVWLRSGSEPIYATAHLAEERVFTSVLTVTYRVLQ